MSLEIERLAAGGEGVARLDGMVWFVSGGIPGDRLQAQVLEQKERWGRARLLRLLEPSPQRRPVPCPLAEVCGGCPWMALPESLQASFKQNLVEEALARVAGLSRALVMPLLTAPEPLGYRNRLRLVIQGDCIGFRLAGSRRVVDIPHCPTALPVLNVLLARVRAVLRPFLPWGTPHQLELQQAESGALALALIGEEAQRLSTFQLPPELKDLSLSLHLEARALREDEPPRLPFQQANFSQNQRLVDYVREALALDPLARVLDLYCGSGNFSLPIFGDALSVLGVELNPNALAQARALANGQGRWLHADSAQAVRRLVSGGEQFERVILDPPRSGALEVIRQLHALKPERVVYVSCDPATLARDLKEAVARGFSVERVQPFDLMPQTAHVECVATLTRSP